MRTPATERVTLDCTRRPSALTTQPHGQVVTKGTCPIKYPAPIITKGPLLEQVREKIKGKVHLQTHIQLHVNPCQPTREYSAKLFEKISTLDIRKTVSCRVVKTWIVMGILS